MVIHQKYDNYEANMKLIRCSAWVAPKESWLAFEASERSQNHPESLPLRGLTVNDTVAYGVTFVSVWIIALFFHVDVSKKNR